MEWNTSRWRYSFVLCPWISGPVWSIGFPTKKERTDKEQLKEELREYANMLVEIESRFEQYNETDHQQEKRTAEVKQSL